MLAGAGVVWRDMLPESQPLSRSSFGVIVWKGLQQSTTPHLIFSENHSLQEENQQMIHLN